MKKLLLIFILFTYSNSVYVIRRFVGFGVKVDKSNDEYVHTKEDNETYLGISE